MDGESVTRRNFTLIRRHLARQRNRATRERIRAFFRDAFSLTADLMLQESPLERRIREIGAEMRTECGSGGQPAHVEWIGEAGR